jgi:anti-sigma B factor antagonist
MTSQSTIVRTDQIVRLMPVETTTCDEWRAAIALYGEWDVANAGELRAELARHIDAGRRVIRVDAAGVEFMDSTAIGELIAASDRCRLEHGSLILTNVPARMKRLISVAGLEHVLLVDTAGNFAQSEPA